MEIRRRNITVKGKVQGVWYRKHTQEFASKNNINGTVRNLNNGDVYIEAEGNHQQLVSLAEWCWIGSPHSEVTQVLIEEGKVIGFDTFEIVR